MSSFFDDMAAGRGSGHEEEDEYESGMNEYDYTDPFLASESESDVEYSSYLAASARKRSPALAGASAAASKGVRREGGGVTTGDHAARC